MNSRLKGSEIFRNALIFFWNVRSSFRWFSISATIAN